MNDDQPNESPPDPKSSANESSKSDSSVRESFADAPTDRDQHSIADSFFSADPDRPLSSDAAELETPDRIGDYEVVGTLGKGGMGVVYLARQKAANRTVALKVIRPEHLTGMSPEQRERALIRFRTEAQAAAKLDHENMVTLYDVGESNGQQFLSMRYVEGKSLADVLRFGPIDNRPAASYLQQVSRAVHDAHEQGILHRDLKPQNILIDAKTDRALVTDFGLAKLTEQEDSLTRDGDVMGTPQYMSPEQARDSASVTVQSDVYALGATLYHMLTGRPVFQAATVWETLRQVMDRQPVSPRQLNPAIDLDLDTIALKCLEKDPERRYESAGDLADELQRYLTGVPIHARPISAVGRLRRWSRRNPFIAASVATAIVCMVTAFVAVSISLVQTRTAYRRSEESFKQALDAVNEFFTTVSEETLLDQPGLKPLRQDLMRQALVYYERFLKQRADDPTVKDLLGVTQYRVGLITAEIGTHEDALKHLTLAIDLQRQSLADRPTDTAIQSALAKSFNARGEELFHLGRMEASLDSFRQSQSLREGLVDSDPSSIEYRRLLANTHMNLGIVFKRGGNMQAAFQSLEDAKTIREELSHDHPNNPKVLRDVAKGYYALGGAYSQDERFAQADSYFGKAIESFSKLIDLQPSADDHYLLSGSHFSRGVIRKPADAVDDYRFALQEISPIATINPNVDKYQSMVINCSTELSYCYEQLGEVDSAIDLLRAGRTTAIAMAARDDRHSSDVAQILLELSRLESRDEDERRMWVRYQNYIVDALDELPGSESLNQLKREIDQRVSSLKE